MRSVLALVIYLIVVFLGGALLAPWLYHLAQSTAAGSSLAQSPFHRYVDRCLLGLALIGLWPLLYHLRMRTWRALGLSGARYSGRDLGFGFLIGFGSLALVAGFAIMSGSRQFQIGPHFGKNLSGAILAAVLVPILEELLFRGALFGALRKAMRWTVALVISSAVYALVHFLKKGDSPPVIEWNSGLIVLGQMFRNFLDWDYVMPAFLVLFLAGAILALAYQRTGSLYMSMGLHAGWIFWLKSYLLLTKTTKGAHEPFWGSDRLIDGWLAFIILLAVFVAIWKWLPSRSKTDS